VVAFCRGNNTHGDEADHARLLTMAHGRRGRIRLWVVRGGIGEHSVRGRGVGDEHPSERERVRARERKSGVGFDPGGSLDRRVKLSLRVPAQMG
jgi:hypothetical protein